jgi:hypothetical protein
MIRPIVRGFLVLGTVLAVVVFGRLATTQYPLQLTEVAVLTSAAQLAQGAPAYAEPAHSDSPGMMPGLPFAVSPLVRMFGADVWEPRAVALACIAAIALLLLAIVRLETASWTLGVSSVGFLSLGLNLLASPPGLVRPELLMLVLVLLAFLALRLSDGIAGPLLAGLALSAAFFCSTQAAWYVMAAIFAMAIDNRRRLLVLALVLGVFLGGGYVLLSNKMGPWFDVVAWGSPLDAVRWSPEGPLLYVGGTLLGKLGVLTLAAVLSFALPTAPWKGKGGLWMCLGLAAFASALVETQTKGFGSEALVPSLVTLALLGPISMMRVTGHLSAWPGSSRTSGQGVVLAALVMQFLMFFAYAQEAWRLAY